MTLHHVRGRPPHSSVRLCGLRTAPEPKVGLAALRDLTPRFPLVVTHGRVLHGRVLHGRVLREGPRSPSRLITRDAPTRNPSNSSSRSRCAQARNGAWVRTVIPPQIAAWPPSPCAEPHVQLERPNAHAGTASIRRRHRRASFMRTIFAHSHPYRANKVENTINRIEALAIRGSDRTQNSLTVRTRAMRHPNVFATACTVTTCCEFRVGMRWAGLGLIEDPA